MKIEIGGEPSKIVIALTDTDVRKAVELYMKQIYDLQIHGSWSCDVHCAHIQVNYTSAVTHKGTKYSGALTSGHNDYEAAKAIAAAKANETAAKVLDGLKTSDVPVKTRQPLTQADWAHIAGFIVSSDANKVGYWLVPPYTQDRARLAADVGAECHASGKPYTRHLMYREC